MRTILAILAITMAALLTGCATDTPTNPVEQTSADKDVGMSMMIDGFIVEIEVLCENDKDGNRICALISEALMGLDVDASKVMAIDDRENCDYCESIGNITRCCAIEMGHTGGHRFE